MTKHTPQLPLFTIIRDGSCEELPQIVPITNKQIKDMTGQVFGRLTVLGFVGAKSKIAIWLCRCQCGKHRSVRGGSLRSGNTLSCGCLQQEKLMEAIVKHGMNNRREYRTWKAMLERCRNPNNSHYHIYGSRGITVCQEWQHSFVNFLADLGPKPSAQHSIDRIDNSASYSCGHCEQCTQEGWTANCRWATPEEQASNTRRNHYLEFGGERLTIARWATKLGIKRSTIWDRIKAGWTVEDALTRPIKQ